MPYSIRSIYSREINERLEVMIESIEKAQRYVFIVSELSPESVANNSAHQRYLKALNDCVNRKKEDRKFEIIRLIVVDENEDINSLFNSGKGTLYKFIPYYGEHFHCLHSFRARALQVCPGGPKNFFMMLIDDDFIFLQMKHDTGLECLNERLESGHAWKSARKMAQDYEACFQNMRDISSVLQPPKL